MHLCKSRAVGVIFNAHRNAESGSRNCIFRFHPFYESQDLLLISKLARESWRGIRVGISRHNTSPNPSTLRSTTVGAKQTSPGRSAPSRSVYQMGGGLTPATDIYSSPPVEAGVFHLIKQDAVKTVLQHPYDVISSVFLYGL